MPTFTYLVNECGRSFKLPRPTEGIYGRDACKGGMLGECGVAPEGEDADAAVDRGAGGRADAYTAQSIVNASLYVTILYLV